MEMKQYLTESARTAASKEGVSYGNFHDNPRESIQSASTAIRAGITADCVKRSIFYREPKEKVDARYVAHMQKFSELQQKLANSSIAPDADINLFHAILGIVSEAGELMEEFINAKLDGRPINYNDGKGSVKEEIGDVLWYTAMAIREIKGETFESVGESNINKLKARFPEKFESEQALNRDEESEKVALNQ